MKVQTKKTIQIIVQTGMLIGFSVLFIMGKAQLWMAVFIGSLLLSVFFSRFYCGWLCPIRTIQRPLTFIKKKLGLKQRPGPAFLKTKITRSLVLAGFLILMLIVFRTGQQLPVLPALLAAGVIISLIFSENLWHRWLCPYGTLLALPTGRLGKRLQISQQDCISCGICERVCPSSAVNTFKISDASAETKEQLKRGIGYQISHSDCLICLECQRQCPVQAIKYHQVKAEK